MPESDSYFAGGVFVCDEKWNVLGRLDMSIPDIVLIAKDSLGGMPTYLYSLPNGQYASIIYLCGGITGWVARIVDAEGAARWLLGRGFAAPAHAPELAVELRKLDRPFPLDPPPTEDDARDAWLYDQRCKGTPDKAIVTDLKKNAAEKGWRIIGTVQGVRERAAAYAKRHGLPLPPKRRQ